MNNRHKEKSASCLIKGKNDLWSDNMISGILKELRRGNLNLRILVFWHISG